MIKEKPTVTEQIANWRKVQRTQLVGLTILRYQKLYCITQK